MRATLLALVLCSCGGEVKLGPTEQSALMATLSDLAAFGNKHIGSDENRAAAGYIVGRMKAIGLTDVHEESFAVPRWQSQSASMTLTIDGAAVSAPFEVFESSGSGHADGTIVWANHANDGDLAGLDLTGKIALVVRDPSFHRAAQYKNVTDKGAAAMLYLSIAPSNLRQVGSVRYAWEPSGTIPAITIGADDGAIIQAAVQAGKDVHALIDVAVTSTPSTGNNLIGRIEGERPEQIVLGAHYDTWFAGSTDNGGGVAELLALADRRVRQAKPRYTLVFVAYDGEEVALYGGYDFLRKHIIVAKDPVLAVINFESPSAKDAQLAGLARSNQPALDAALSGSGLDLLYVLYTGLEAVAGFFGGIIPTDIQGTYRSGVPTVSTAVSGPYYHTTEDTPDKVDLALLAGSVDDFDKSLGLLLKDEPEAFSVKDPKLWTADVTVGAGTVDAIVKDANGTVQAGAIAHCNVLVDDFTPSLSVDGMTDAAGHVSFAVPTSATTAGTMNRFVHVTAGPTYPLVEKIVALP